MSDIEVWLQKVAPSTRKKYRIYIGKMKNYFGKSAEEILAEYNALNTAKELKDFGRKYNTVLQGLWQNKKLPYMATNAVRAWFRDNAVRLEGKIRLPNTPENYYRLTTADLRQMLYVADLDQQAKILLGNNTGLRPIDVCLFRRVDFENLIKFIDERHEDYREEPYLLQVSTRKTGSVANCCLMDETVNVLRKYLKATPPNSKWLFTNNWRNRVTGTALNEMLRGLYLKAYPRKALPSKFSWKCFRKRLKRLMAKAGVNDVYRKAVVGHDTGLGKSYEMGEEGSEEDIREEFKKVIPLLQITAPLLKTEAESKIESLEKQLAEFKNEYYRDRAAENQAESMRKK